MEEPTPLEILENTRSLDISYAVLSTRNQTINKFVRTFPYGLITYNPHGDIRRFDVSVENPHPIFEMNGWKHYPGAGYFDDEGNIAEAFELGHLILYPEWHIND